MCELQLAKNHRKFSTLKKINLPLASLLYTKRYKQIVIKTSSYRPAVIAR
jgi:hypothetical protein